jgi:hypothetical protein
MEKEAQIFTAAALANDMSVNAKRRFCIGTRGFRALFKGLLRQGEVGPRLWVGWRVLLVDYVYGKGGSQGVVLLPDVVHKKAIAIFAHGLGVAASVWASYCDLRVAGKLNLVVCLDVRVRYLMQERATHAEFGRAQCVTSR